MKKVPISKEMCDYVESLMYELDARRDLCAFMVGHGMSDTEHFEKYHDAYLKANAEYAVAKTELAKLAGEGKRWRLDFENRELVVEDAD